MSVIIGRVKEIKELNRLYTSGQPQFVAIYGRRRVGKTFLVDEALKGKIAFRHAGLSPVDSSSHKNLLKDQLKNFQFSLMRQGFKDTKVPGSWLEAFFMLETFLESKDNGKPQVVFLDELPWMDTPRSGFITALEAFWNGWGCHRNNLMLVVCGSATSWMQNKLVNNHGGLYDRLTYEMKLSPFTLAECGEFFDSKGIRLSHYDVAQSYMAVGGIPYYLGYFQRGLSLAQNIDNLFFAKDAKLLSEYERLFSSVFTRPEDEKKIVEFLCTRHYGYTREEIINGTGIPNNGNFSKLLDALVASDFVEAYVPFGFKKRALYYKLTDPYSLFYIRFLLKNRHKDDQFWLHNENTPSIAAWRGIAFEGICFSHINQIKKALGVEAVASSQSAWTLKGDGQHDGAQVDLLIDRADHIVNMCEMKFYSDDFAVDKAYYRKLQSRRQLLSEQLPRKTAIHQTLVTTYGLAYNEYSGIFQNVIVLDDLFL